MSVAQHINRLQHIGIPTKDIGKTVQFYESLGFEQRYRDDEREEPVVFLELQGVMVETYQTGAATGIPGAIDHIAMDVDDIDATYREVTALGYAALDGAVQFLPFWEKGVKFFTISGPNGEKVEFSQKL